MDGVLPFPLMQEEVVTVHWSAWLETDMNGQGCMHLFCTDLAHHVGAQL